MQTINLDLSVRSIIPLLHAKQGDVGRKFKAILTDGGVAYPVPAGAAVSVWYSGASGEGNYTDIGADSAVSVSGNEITVELITQMLANYGEGKLCLAINTADGDQIGTWNIPYMVEPLPGMGSAAAQAYFTAFSQAVQNLPYPDNTLSVAGKAADAGAVGTALALKAPAGYGLGEHSVYTADCHSITENGWYFTDVSTLNAPPESQYGTILAKTRGEAIVLEYTDIDGGKKYQAVRMASGAWIDWVRCDASAFAPSGHIDAIRIVSSDLGIYATLQELATGKEQCIIHAMFSVTELGLELPGGTVFVDMYVATENYYTVKAYHYSSSGGASPVELLGSGYEKVFSGFYYLNPPMEIGVEYRTTERWNNRVVWTTLVNLGQLTTGNLSVNTGIEVTNLIRHSGNATGDRSKISLPTIYTRLTEWGQWIIAETSNNGTVELTAYRGSSYTKTATIYCQLWYTKD